MVTVRVPATSANLGSGFDSCGIALSMYNTASFEEWDGVDISSSDGSEVPKTEENLIYKTAKTVYEQCGRRFTGLRIVQTNTVPMARGLGSSSTCIAAGILGANELLGRPLVQSDVLSLASALEGHPDNVAPALLGGFTVSAVGKTGVSTCRQDIRDDLQFAAFIPDFRLLTKTARSVLPEMIPREDAVFNIQRAGLLCAAFACGKYELLRTATQDRIHQTYRLPLIGGGREVFETARSAGAEAVWISGAGPTILAAVRKENAQVFFDAARRQMPAHFELKMLRADNEGAVIL